MQTFLPYSDFAATAAVLDARRLGKQRVEVLQILRALTFDDYGWRTHPAVTMWSGHTAALVTYGVVISERWVADGYADTVRPLILEFVAPELARPQSALAAGGELPWWLGWEPLHRSHRAALLRKDPEHYGPQFPGVDPDLPYVWPAAPPLQPASGPVSAWVVRATAADAASMRAASFVGLRPLGDEEPAAPAGRATRNTKRRRQVRAFQHDMCHGHRVIVPLGDALLVGEVVGDYEWRRQAPHGLHHARRVHWLGGLPRSVLRRPVNLQDPRLVFPLRDEHAIAEAAPEVDDEPAVAVSPRSAPEAPDR